MDNKLDTIRVTALVNHPYALKDYKAGQSYDMEPEFLDIMIRAGRVQLADEKEMIKRGRPKKK